jgi:hypothetical protein
VLQQPFRRVVSTLGTFEHHEHAEKGTLWIEDQHPAPVPSLCEGVLSNQVLQKLRLPGAGAAADVKVLVTFRAGKGVNGAFLTVSWPRTSRCRMENAFS